MAAMNPAAMRRALRKIEARIERIENELGLEPPQEAPKKRVGVRSPHSRMAEIMSAMQARAAERSA